MTRLSGPRIVTPPPGPKSRHIVERLARHELPQVAARQGAREEAAGVDFSPIAYARTEGAFVEDADGNVYVDLAAGFGACILGHAPKEVLDAVRATAAQVWLALGDLYGHEAKAELCERLAALLPREDSESARVALGMTGADALTAAIKSCVLYTQKAGLVAFAGAYHGLSYAPLAACGLSEAFRAPFAMHLGAHVSFVPYPDDVNIDQSLEALANRLSVGDVGGVLIEPVLGRGGCVPAAAGALAAVRALCDHHGALLIVDEVWTGMGRAGAMLASAGVRADLLCLGKGLGAGWPISACVGRASIMRPWGEHGGATVHTATHFGQPAACAAALAALRQIEKHDLPARARRVGDAWRGKLREQIPTSSAARVTGAGLMIGVHLESQRDALRAMRGLLARGYLTVTGGPAGNVLTLTPPLNVNEALLSPFGEALNDSLPAR